MGMPNETLLNKGLRIILIDERGDGKKETFLYKSACFPIKML